VDAASRATVTTTRAMRDEERAMFDIRTPTKMRYRYGTIRGAQLTISVGNH